MSDVHSETDERLRFYSMQRDLEIRTRLQSVSDNLLRFTDQFAGYGDNPAERAAFLAKRQRLAAKLAEDRKDDGRLGQDRDSVIAWSKATQEALKVPDSSADSSTSVDGSKSSKRKRDENENGLPPMEQVNDIRPENGDDDDDESDLMGPWDVSDQHPPVSLEGFKTTPYEHLESASNPTELSEAIQADIYQLKLAARGIATLERAIAEIELNAYMTIEGAKKLQLRVGYLESRNGRNPRDMEDLSSLNDLNDRITELERTMQ